jgi:uncharacterized membrane protein YphA (DoxX/SURF4 family)
MFIRASTLDFVAELPNRRLCTFFARDDSHREEVHVGIERLTTPWWALRVALGAAAFLAGLDKFFNLLADWPGYLSPLAAHVLPMSASSFMHVIGIVEMAVGAVILAGYTQLGGYVAAIWLVGIAVNLVTTGRYFDVAVRDVAMAIAAFTLARLTEAGVGAEVRERPDRLNTLVPHRS